MKKSIKKWIISAIALIFSGGILFTGVMMKNGWDFRKLNTVDYETNTHNVTESFESISIDLDGANVQLLPSEDGLCKVVCYEMENTEHTVNVINNKLTIVYRDHRKWYHHIGFNILQSEVTVYLPQTTYNLLNIETENGNVTVNGFTFNSIDIETDEGNVKLNDCDATNISVDTDDGDVTATLLSGKIFDVETDTGSIRIPENSEGGRCEIETDSGDVKISVK